MGTPGSAPDSSAGDVLRVFGGLDGPRTPLTAAEVAVELECAVGTARRKLDALADDGALETRSIEESTRIWWPTDGHDQPTKVSPPTTEFDQLGAFIDAVLDYAIFRLDPDGRVVSWNDGAERIKGYSAEEVIGEHFSVFYTDEDVEAGAPSDNLEAARTTGHVEDEGWRVRQDGSRFWANVVITAIRDESGEVRGYTKVTRDLTERRAYERDLRRERNFVEQIIETVPISIAVTTPDGDLVQANSQALQRLGIEADDLEGWSLATVELTDEAGDPVEPAETPWARVGDTGEPVYSFQCRAELPNEGRRWVSINAAPIEAAAGSPDRIVLAVEDITTQKERERQLERRKGELETELSEILGRVSDAFYALDEAWRFTHVNEQAEELLQRSSGELLGRSLWEAFPAAEGTTLSDRFQQAMETQNPVSFELDDDELGIWLEVNAYPSPTGLSVYFRDITDRKEREQALERYRTIVETVDDGIYVVDQDGRFTLVNESYVELTDYPRDELLGAPVSLVVDEGVTDSAKAVEAQLLEGTRETMMMEADIQRADGGSRPAEATFALLRSEDGYERIGVVRDITERRAQERALETSERRYRTLVENFPNGVVSLFDEDLRYTAAGGQLLEDLGIEQEEAIGDTIWDRYPEGLAAEIEPHFQDAFKGESATFEADYYGRHLLAHTLPIRNADDQVYAGMLVVQDITEREEYRRQLESTIDELEESNERLEQFAYIASHDLQEPLRMVSSYLQMLETRYASELDDDAREFVGYAVDGADRMRSMVNDLLRYSRLDSDAVPLEPIDSTPVVDRVLDGLTVTIEETDSEVSVGDLPIVVADESQLEQVFQNLVSNALKYHGDDPPRIEIAADREGDRCRFRVTDNGIGIDPMYTDRIFKVFKRLHTREDYPGTGIGLALCRKIVHRHGGDIWVESEPGAGATFYFTIPLADDDR